MTKEDFLFLMGDEPDTDAAFVDSFIMKPVTPTPEVLTASGNPISIATSEAQNAISTILSYSPKQSGTGDPSPQNIRPISGWTGANATVGGKNLFDLSKLATTGITYADGVLTGTASAFNSAYSSGIPYDFSFLKNARVSIAVEAKVQTASGTSNGLRMRITYSDGTYSDFSWKNNNDVYERKYFASAEGKSVSGISITYNSTGSNVWLIRDFQIEVGTVPTAYTPYITPSVYPVSWQTEAGTIYGGILNFTTGLLTVEYIIRTFGEFSYDYASNYGRFVSGSVSGVARPNNNFEIVKGMLCSCYKMETAARTESSQYDNIVGFTRDGNVVIRDSRFTTQSELKAAIGNEKVLFKLSAPLTYQLSPSEVVLLAGNNTLWTEGDEVSVTYTGYHLRRRM